jgi:hypothetical protein
MHLKLRTRILWRLLLSICFFWQWGHLHTIAAPPQRGESPVEITARLDKAVISPGLTVTLEELIPVGMAASVDSIEHEAIRIGRFDPQLQKVINLNKSHFGFINPSTEFDKLPASLGVSHPIDFDVKLPNYIRTPTHKGIKFAFRANRLGIYLITATWHQRGHGERISSNPVVLVVKPPTDASGHAILKPEWLGEDD